MADNLTGLTWMKAPASEINTWQNALAYANNRNTAILCGYDSGWRLPNILELESLINLGQAGSASWLTLPENGFVGIAANTYWSSTTAAAAKGNAWVADFSNDGRYVVEKSLTHFALPVRGVNVAPAQLWQTGQTECYDSSGSVIGCSDTGQDGEIRAGEEWPSPRFADPVNGTVRDNLTGLIWAEDANTPGPQTCTPGIGKFSYEAYPFIQCLNSSNYLGYSDWRLPNRRELLSLIDHSQYNPALPSGHQFEFGTNMLYWTSDTYVSLCSNGWAINMNTGQAMEKDKALEALSIWPVRGPFALKVLFAGDGVGAVSGDGISCSGDRCLGVYYSGETITITAQGSADAVFDGWTGCPSASGSECSIMIGADITITATFLAAKSIWDKPSSLNFGKVGKNVPSPVKYIAVKNLKATNLQIGAVSIIGTNFGEFVFVPEEYCSGVTLLPGQTCTIALNINAQEYGTRRAQLVVTSNDARAPEKIIKLTAKALPAKVHVTPKSLSFGRVNAQGSADQQLTIENKGVTPLSVSSITSIGDDGGNFTFNPAGCPDLQEGESCSLTVTFTPGAIGKRTGTLGITSNAPKKSTVNVKMKGEGI